MQQADCKPHFPELASAVGQMYTDGHLAHEIEHLLVLRLHEYNTIAEVEELKSQIHSLMEDMYAIGEKRTSANKQLDLAQG